MKLSQLIEELQHLENSHGGDTRVLYSSFDKANGFNITNTSCRGVEVLGAQEMVVFIEGSEIQFPLF